MKDNAWQHLLIHKKNPQIVAHHHDKQELELGIGGNGEVGYDLGWS
jgi:hypothetical protein